MPPPFHGRNTGFEAGTAGAPSPLRWFLRLLYPKHHTRRTTAAYRFYRSSHAGCRFGRNGNSWFAVGCYLLYPSNHGFASAVRRNLGRRRYRYICRSGGFLARGGCPSQTKRVWFSGSSESGAASFLGTGCPPSCAISLAAREASSPNSRCSTSSLPAL